jgi:hypothetical protein
MFMQRREVMEMFSDILDGDDTVAGSSAIKTQLMRNLQQVGNYLVVKRARVPEI